MNLSPYTNLPPLSSYALTHLSLERTNKGGLVKPVYTNRDRWECYQEQLRRNGLLSSQRRVLYEEYTIRFPVGMVHG